MFTDIEGSTQLLSDLGTARYQQALAKHRAKIQESFDRFDGYEVDSQGDSFFYTFQSAASAVAAVREATAALADGPIRVRIGVHTGEPRLAPPGYVGMDVHRAARIMACAHGGQVVLSQATRQFLEDQVELRDLGEHRLKDLSAPLRLYQLGDGDFPPLRSLYRTNLPVPATPFLGRRRELAEIAALLTRDDLRLLTLTGPGGTGKTRLALQAAADAADRYPGGVFWVPLAVLRDPALVVAAVARTLGVEEETGTGIAQSIARSISARTVLLVDNCEHLLPGVSRALLSFLETTEDIRVLATSREPLSLAAEHVVTVDPLERFDAVELFNARAEAAGAKDVDHEAVAALCARLDDLPLAIELAAARAPAFPPSLLVEHLPERLELLRGPRDAEERQQTLVATMSWSYELLSPAEQRALRNLSIFVGSATPSAAERVAEADIEELATLVGKSLMRMTSTVHGPRYWMLETIRQFVARRLDETEFTRLQQRYVGWFASLAREASPELGERDAVRWLDRLDADIGNLRQALTIAQNVDEEAAIALGILLSELHIVRGRYAEAGETLKSTRAHAHGRLSAAKLERLLGNLLVRRNEVAAATAAYAAAEERLGAPPSGDLSWWREWLELKLNQATIHYWAGDSAALRAAADELRPRIAEHGTPRQRAYFGGVQIMDALRRERYAPSDQTEALARAYCEMATEAGDWDGDFMLAFVLLWRGELAEAEEHFRKGRRDALTAGDVLTEIRCLVYETVVQRRLGDVERVRSLDEEIADLDDTYGYDGLIAANRAWLAWRCGDDDATEKWGATALAAWAEAAGTAPASFQWTARFPLLAVEVQRDDLARASEHARLMLDPVQQELPRQVRELLEGAARTGSREALLEAVDVARRHGYT